VRCKYNETPSGVAIKLTIPDGGKIEFTSHVPGEHNARNAAAACAIAIALDIAPEAISRGLASYTGTKGRLQKKIGLNGAVVIDDTYNANPESMAAAIAVLAKVAGTRVFVMGDMGELGDQASAMHAETGALAKHAGIDRLLALGNFTTRAVEAFGSGGQHFASVVHLADALRPLMQKDTAVLVKGSRFMHMEQVVEAISMPIGY
jgi:UDP-N-acetylmuramoyl-tripeptide--D-alanyl-D-alanine ligase